MERSAARIRHLGFEDAFEVAIEDATVLDARLGARPDARQLAAPRARLDAPRLVRELAARLLALEEDDILPLVQHDARLAVAPPRLLPLHVERLIEDLAEAEAETPVPVVPVVALVVDARREPGRGRSVRVCDRAPCAIRQGDRRRTRRRAAPE